MVTRHRRDTRFHVRMVSWLPSACILQKKHRKFPFTLLIENERERKGLFGAAAGRGHHSPSNEEGSGKPSQLPAYCAQTTDPPQR